MISAVVIADSISPLGYRLTTMELNYPRFIHSELMTHRVFSRNAASSRAIPTKKLIEQVRTNPAMPIEWGSNKPGMQAGDVIAEARQAEAVWRVGAHRAAAQAELLMGLGLHKQVANRVLEPFMWMKTIVSATEWDNFFEQRLAPESQPEMCELALAMSNARDCSDPQYIGPEEWHLPYLDKSEVGSENEAIRVSAARCARVSYLNHDGKRDVDKDLDLYARLLNGGHWSPLEHVATPGLTSSSNFAGWRQLRHLPEYR